jgi:negative regulator of flagellin synthesis FlgM
MVIDTNNINASGGARSRTITTTSNPKVQTTTAEAPPPEATSPSNKDKVMISPEAQNLSRLQAKINLLPEINLERVAAIKQAISEGRFEINPERIAENMLNHDELFN